MSNRSPLALSHVKFRHLMLVELLISEGTIRKVAKHLNVSQPAATAMLNEFEKLIGLRLFDRSAQGVVPTEHALTIAPRLRTILNEFDDLVVGIGRVAAGADTMLRLGVVPQAFLSHLSQAIEIFRQSGGCAVKTEEGTASQLLHQLLEGELDCVVGRLPNDGPSLKAATARLEVVNLYQEDVCIVVGPSNDATTRKRISYEYLAGCNWVMQRSESSVRRALAESFLRKGIFLPDPVVETSSYIQNLAVVAKSNLFTVVPRSAAEAQQALGLVRILDVRLDVRPMQVALITRRTSSRHDQVQRFKQAFLDALAVPPSAVASRCG